jgi:citrate lyase subunit beta/citryl-CoA lyase
LASVRPRRSVLYVPADNARALEKARGLEVDVLILDLEDAVAPEEKEQARKAACAAVDGFRPREVVIRINRPGADYCADDLAAAVRAKPDAILLPKVHNSAEIGRVRHTVRDIPLWAMIESPAAVLNLNEIAASGVTCLVLGANDLIKDMGGRHRPDRANLAYAMSQMVLTARAHGIAALDGVHNRLDDEAGFAAACEMARDFGFDGKTLIHPAQVTSCHAAFVPSEDEVEAARRVLKAFADNPGKGAILLDGQMVERLHAEIAERVLARAT